MKFKAILMTSVFVLSFNTVPVHAWTDEGLPENMHEAAYCGALELLKSLFNQEFRYVRDINGPEGRTVLELASMGGHQSVLQFLAEFYTTTEIHAAQARCFNYYQQTFYPPAPKGYDNPFAEGDEAI